MFLMGKDYLSIWEVAHRWAGVDPTTTQEEYLPEQVQYFIHKMVEGYWNSQLRLRHTSGRKIPRESIWLFVWNLNFWQKYMERCLFENHFDKTKLDNFLVKRSELISLCLKEDIDPPDFWNRKKQELLPDSKPSINYRPKDELIDRFVCQAIARTYWDIDPQIHPAHLAKSKAISLYGNGKQYKDENTIKNWITEVDPLKNQRKIGRPKDVDYLIDLETGALSRNYI